MSYSRTLHSGSDESGNSNPTTLSLPLYYQTRFDHQPTNYLFTSFLTSYGPESPLSFVFMHICSIYCKLYGQRYDCFLGTSLTRVHSVFIHDKIYYKVHLNKCSRYTIFKRQKYLRDKR